MERVHAGEELEIEVRRMMRIFFPGLLLLVALTMFVKSVLFLVEYSPIWQDGYFHTTTVITRGDYLSGAALLLASTWAATWAWKDITRERAWRSRLEE